MILAFSSGDLRQLKSDSFILSFFRNPTKQERDGSQILSFSIILKETLILHFFNLSDL